MSAQPVIISLERLAELEALLRSVERSGDAMRAEVRRQQGINGTLLGKLTEAVVHIAAAQRDLRQTGLDQPRELLEPLLDEISERVAAAYSALSLTLYVAEMRVDLDGRDDVTVLAVERERLRAAGRRL